VPYNAPVEPTIVPLRKEEFDRWLDLFGPNEAVTAAAAILVGQTAQLIPPNTFDLLRQEHTAVPSSDEVEAYRTKYIGRADILKPRIIDRKTDNYTGALAFFGVTLGMDLDFPETSRQRIFGVGRAAGRRLRYDLLHTIVEYPDWGLPITEVTQLQNNRNDGTTYKKVWDTAAHLREQGFVTLGAPMQDIVVEIQSPEYRGRPGKLSQTGVAAYKAIELFWREGITRIQYAELEQKALALDPEIDVVKLRKMWSDMHSKDHYFPGLRRAETTSNTPDQTRSVLALHEDHAAAIKALVEGMRSIQWQRSAVFAQMARAREILSSRQTLATLFARADRFSTYRGRMQPSRERMGDSILRIMQSGERLSAIEVQERLAADGQTATAMAISNKMLALMRLGKLVRKKERDPDGRYGYRYRLMDSADEMPPLI
jgi:hypothetical protein